MTHEARKGPSRLERVPRTTELESPIAGATLGIHDWEHPQGQPGQDVSRAGGKRRPFEGPVKTAGEPYDGGVAVTGRYLVAALDWPPCASA